MSRAEANRRDYFCSCGRVLRGNGAKAMHIAAHERLGDGHGLVTRERFVTLTRDTGQRVCTKCGAAKDTDEFQRDRRCPDGRRPWCKSCTREYRHEANRRNRDANSARNRAWRRANPERVVEHARRKAERHPEKLRAQAALRQAVYDGRLVRPETCGQCGAAGQIDGHHDDYSKPLDVRWLCRLCHRAEHLGAVAQVPGDEHNALGVSVDDPECRREPWWQA